MEDHLVVVSKVKKMIKETSGMNTSSSVMAALNTILTSEIKKAVENARKDRRKTVMDRDFANE